MGPRPARRPLRRAPPLARRGVAAPLLAAALAFAGCDRAPSPATPAATAPTAPAGPAVVDAGARRFEAGAAPSGAALPEDIARGLSTDAGVLDCEAGVVDGRSAFAPEWVAVHRVHLDADGREDWLVEGRHACLAGNGEADWWAYAEGPSGRRLLYAAGRARAVEVLPARSEGHADLRVERRDGAEVVRFDGAAYAPVTAGD